MQIKYEKVEFGLCPHCDEHAQMISKPLTTTIKEKIFECSLCHRPTKLYINGEARFIEVTVPFFAEE